MTAASIAETFQQSPVTYCLMLIVALFSVAGSMNQKLFYKFILHPQSVVRDKQYFRILTADWTNADVMHLMLNELTFYVFCTHLEFTLRGISSHGSLQYLIIYAVSLLFGSAIIILKYRRKFEYSTTGTSGSIMGCMFSFMLLDPNYVILNLPGIGPVKNIYGGLVYILILFIYQRRKKEDLINNEFHFYGAIGGILATLVMHPEVLQWIRG
jgi:membrane associated rhomboid family serine protease